MLLRDRDAGTDHHRHGGSMLDEILVCWDPEARLDSSPLLDLLNAVALCGADEAQTGNLPPGRRGGLVGVSRKRAPPWEGPLPAAPRRTGRLRQFLAH
jgi:hypothetical protein